MKGSLPVDCRVHHQIIRTMSENAFQRPLIVTSIPFQTMIIIKYMFQFAFFPWNQITKLNAPFWPPRILGIEKKEQYAVYDLLLLLIIFFHR